MAIATVVIAIATKETAKVTKGIHRSNDRSNDILMAESKPIISFAITREEEPAWELKNVGKGTGLNVMIAHINKDGEDEQPIRNYNAIEPSKGFRILWKKYPYKCGDTYHEGKLHITEISIRY